MKIQVKLCLTLLVVLMVGGCTSKSDSPNVILITIDTLCADHLGCYGYSRNTSPNFDSFAASATRYSRSYASSPWTLPTHASMFTGLDPDRHGARTIETQKPSNNVKSLDEQSETLAEVMSAQGYRTGAIVANDGYLDKRWGLDQGFESYDVERVRAVRINAKVDEWLGQNGQDNFFLFINYMDTHRPYDTTPRLEFLNPPAPPDSRKLLDQLIAEVMPATGGAFPADLVQDVIDQYDTSIANFDEQFGQLIASLEARGLMENTVLVVTSDHGEFFGEHDLVEHSKDVYQEVLHVPLAVLWPGQQPGEVVHDMVSSSDLPGMILDACGMGAATDQFLKRPGNHPVISSNWYTRTKDLYHPEWGHRFQRVRHVLFDWPYKYIDSSDGQHELYDLSVDPGEQENLVMSLEPVAGNMQMILMAAVTDDGGDDYPAPAELDAATKRRLKSLGYVSE